jgi:ComF family protein
MNLLDLIFPKKCLECGKDGKYICDVCIGKVSLYGANDSNYSIFKYQGVIRKAIISLKYKFAYDIAGELVGRIVNLLISNKQFLNKKFVLIPIPLFKQRQNWRGFNQSELIGEKLAKQMGWKFIPDLLIRNKNTTPQVGLKGSVRRANLSGVFEVSSNYTLYPKPYTLVLFDDVFTTGSTINEAKKVLKEAGFNNIKSLTIAR